LRSLYTEEFALAEIEYCGQGEPLLHPRFHEFVRTARRWFPETPQRVITSGNFDYAATIGPEAPDEIMVSCDGVWAESYARYRVGGNVERVIRFMRDAQSAAAGGGRPMVIWKYILFEWNDSDEELREAQFLAQEIGVAALLFVCTHSAGKSRRYTLENVGTLPICAPNVVTNATPIHYQLAE